MSPLRELDPVLHSQLRLAVVSILMKVLSAEFSYLLDKTGATRGNLSVQLKKLEEAGYISIAKSFRGNYPLTTCELTPEGREAFEKYVDALKEYLGSNE
jgi:DNA-binding MarR family transcriptional regulator